MKNAVEVLEDFMEAWKNEDWNGMWKNSQKTWRSKRENNAERLFDLFGHKNLLEYGVVGFNEVSDCCVDVEVKIKYTTDPHDPFSAYEYTIRPRLLNEIKEYTPSKEGEWGVNPISMLKEQ